MLDGAGYGGSASGAIVRPSDSAGLSLEALNGRPLVFLWRPNRGACLSNNSDQ